MKQKMIVLVLAVSGLFLAVEASASYAKLSTLDNSLQDVNSVEVFFAQKKTEKHGAWECSVSLGKTTSFATEASPETITTDLTEGLDYNSLNFWTTGIDAKQDHEDDGLNVTETGLYVQKKIYYTKPSKKKKPVVDSDSDEDEPYYPSLAVKVRVASGATSEGAKVKQTTTGKVYPVLFGFKEKNDGISLTWDLAENWSAGAQFTQYQYIGFDKTQAYLYAHPGIAARLSGATSSVSSVVDHEEVLNVQWFFSDDWDVNLTETLQTDYVTGDLGTTTQIDLTWDLTSDWTIIFSANFTHTTPTPAAPPPPAAPTIAPFQPSQDVPGWGLAVSYNW